MKDVKFATIDERNNGTGDVFTEFFDTKEDAISSARRQWEHLTRSEQSKRTITVVRMECDEDGEPDFGNQDVIAELKA